MEDQTKSKKFFKVIKLFIIVFIIIIFIFIIIIIIVIIVSLKYLPVLVWNSDFKSILDFSRFFFFNWGIFKNNPFRQTFWATVPFSTRPRYIPWFHVSCLNNFGFDPFNRFTFFFYTSKQLFLLLS